MPPAPPSIQMFVPSVLTAPRGFDPVEASLSAVVVSTPPAASTRAMTRLIVPEDEEVTLVPGAASYPAAVRYRPSVDRVNSPSEVAVPLAVNALLLPLAAVGSAMDWTGIPVVEYSPRKSAVAPAAIDPLPVPTR